ncbi:MAG TPA: hypothetical protein DCX07_02060, partial [Phycisphaerales bacterium]|nr:hypothetical protein [Phycisphaerales bacterium]
MVHTLPTARGLTVALWVVLLVSLGWAVGRHGSLSPARIDEKATLSVLQSEELAFLVTRRAVTQVVLEHRESDLWGEWHGVLWASVSWRWGVDMRKIAPADLSRQGDTLVVRLPEPELLDFAMEPGSVGFISKSTAAPKLLDFARGGWQRSVLEAQLRRRALEFAAAHHLLPSRREIVAQLNA